MKKNSYLIPRVYNFCGTKFPFVFPIDNQCIEMIRKIFFVRHGISCAYFSKQIQTIPLNRQRDSAMGDMPFYRKLELNETVKYGAMLYFVLAFLIMPAGICSSQHLALQFVPPTPYTVAQIAMDRDFEAVSNYLMPMEGILDHDPVPQEKEALPPPIPYHHSIMRASQAYKVDAALIRAIIHAESNYNPQAVSRAGAQGLMQLMPSTARSLGVEDTFDPDLNIDGGVRYFKRLLDRFDGDVELALAAYNAGSRHVRNYGGVPPFRATQLYIQKVLKFTRIYRQEMTDRVDYT